jgi:predicted GH43/DUF377 family glycosyl hydrolase
VKSITDPSAMPLENPVMQWGDTGKKIDKDGNPIPFAKDPTVIRFRDKYLMYFSLPPDMKERKPYGWTIGIAESTDRIHWTRIADVPPFQDCDAKGLCAPCTKVWNNRVYMFYQSYGGKQMKDDGICLAWSDDGIRFTAHSKNPIFKPHGDWTNTRAIDAEFVVFKDKLFLYGSTRDPGQVFQKTVVATADPKGLNDPENKLGPDAWTLAFDGAILDPELPWETKCIEATTICQRGDKLIMFYAGGYNNDPQQIGVARSTDGIHWTRLWSVPFIPNGPSGQWNSSESGHPGVFVDDDGKTYLYYQGNPDKGKSWFLSVVEIGWKDDVPFVKL